MEENSKRMERLPVKEKKMTVAEAVKIAFSEMGKEFSILTLVHRTRELLDRPSLMDGTVTKELRNARKGTELDYEVIDQHKAIYKKLRDWNNPTVLNQLSMF